MQFERFYRLNKSIVAWFAHLDQEGFHHTFPNLGSICGGNGVRVKPYAHPKPEKWLKYLYYVMYGYGMQFERFYNLNQSIMAWFAHLLQVGFQLALM
jgi:hypothetical protein